MNRKNLTVQEQSFHPLIVLFDANMEVVEKIKARGKKHIENIYDDLTKKDILLSVLAQNKLNQLQTQLYHNTVAAVSQRCIQDLFEFKQCFKILQDAVSKLSAISDKVSDIYSKQNKETVLLEDDPKALQHLTNIFTTVELMRRIQSGAKTHLNTLKQTLIFIDCAILGTDSISDFRRLKYQILVWTYMPDIVATECKDVKTYDPYMAFKESMNRVAQSKNVKF